MSATYQRTDSPDSSPPPPPPPTPTVETENPPLQVTHSPSSSSSSSSSIQISYILQFSGATASTAHVSASTSRADAGASTSRADASASTSSGDAGASTSRRNGFSGPTGALTSNGHGFSGLSGASTSSGNGFHGPTGASTSNGNGFYGPAGAAALLRVKEVEESDEFAVVIHRFRQGLGNQTISVAQYRGLILGLTETLRRGYREITVQGNSELIINQQQFLGDWEINYPELMGLRDEALELSNSFESFFIHHIDQNLSRAVDNEAVRAISLLEGQIEEESHIY